MSDDDLLAKATRELREAGDPPLPELRQTRRRIVEAAGRAEKPSRRWVWLVGQLAAFMLAATALAATTGQLQPLIERVREVLGGSSEGAPESFDEAPGAGRVGRPPRSAVGGEPMGDVAPEAEELAVASTELAVASTELAVAPTALSAADARHGAPVTEASPVGGAGLAGRASSPLGAGAGGAPPAQPAHAAGAQDERAAPLAGSRASDADALAADADAEVEAGLAHANDPDLALYREAHRAHFVQRNWGAALAGWDRYLAAHPRGNFAVEARYNRALCLVRLGRHDAARQALAPFAAGAVGGGYRSAEASALLEALEGR